MIYVCGGKKEEKKDSCEGDGSAGSQAELGCWDRADFIFRILGFLVLGGGFGGGCVWVGEGGGFCLKIREGIERGFMRLWCAPICPFCRISRCWKGRLVVEGGFKEI